MSASTLSQQSENTLARSAINGINGGIVGGIVFGIMMQLQGMIPMVASLVGSQEVVIGWVVHLLISTFIGAVFGVIASRLASGWGLTLGAGIINGVVWWVLGALVLMPLMLGMNEMILQVGEMQVNSLIGHVIFGLIAAVVYRLLAQRG